MSSKAKRLFGVGSLVIGAALIVFSLVIKQKVREGQGKITNAEQSVQKGQGLFGSNPYTKPLGDNLMSGANNKIAAGKESIAYYTLVSNIMMVGGIVLVVLGGGLIIFGKKSAH
jgi:hypothetical protein